MILMTLPELKPGMVLAKHILSDAGELLLASGFVLNDRIIHKLLEMELSGCWIYEEGTEFVVPEEMISEQIALQAKGALIENLELAKRAAELQELTQESVAKVMSETSRFRNIVAVEKVKGVVREIMEALVQKDPVLVNLTSIRTKSGYLYQHALDVTITAIMLSQRLKFTLREVEDLALGTLLMDYGLVIMADAVVGKKDRLTLQEASLLKEHPTFGYAILRENEKIPLTTAHVAYQHHERQDGNGYPRRLRGLNQPPDKVIRAEKGLVHRYAEIAAVCDTYISLISPRPHTVPPKSPEEAMEYLIKVAGTQLNRGIVDTLITMVPVYPTGARIVVVEDKARGGRCGFSGVVARSSPEDPGRPIIVLIRDADKRPIAPLTVDLREEAGVRIQFQRLG